jgi:hypothetical protein
VVIEVAFLFLVTTDQSFNVAFRIYILGKFVSILFFMHLSLMNNVRMLYRTGWAAATTGLQPIRVWGGATLAAGCCLPLAAATTNPNGLSQPIRVRVGGGAASLSCCLSQPPHPGAAGP